MFKCRSCGEPVTRSFIDLKLSPLANSYVARDNGGNAEKFYPLHVFVCDSCHLVQLTEFESPEHIFSEDYAYYSSFSASWLAHAEKYSAEMIERFGLSEDAHVAEAASNDGYLLQYFVQKGLKVTGIEPAANCAQKAEEKGVHSIVSFFGMDTVGKIVEERSKADLIAANNVLAHVPDIRDFVAAFEAMLSDDGVATFEFPHLMKLVEFNQFDTIYHEHFSYLSVVALKPLFEQLGMRIFDIQELPTHGGSLRLFTCKKDASHATEASVDAMVKTEIDFGLVNVETYESYAAKVLKVKNDFTEFLINEKRKGKTIAAYGAPAKGNTLLNYCGVGSEYIDFTVDRNPVKQNTYLPGSRIPVYDVDKIDEEKPDYLVILPWNLRDEIVGQMGNIRSWDGKFVVAIPSLEVF